jgi:hypothetical protein
VWSIIVSQAERKSLFFVGVAALFFAPETRGKDLPE